jgi:hypothetical protein
MCIVNLQIHQRLERFYSSRLDFLWYKQPGPIAASAHILPYTYFIVQMGVTEVFCITVVGGIFCVSVIHAEGNCLILFVTDTHKVGHNPTPPLVCMFVLVWLGPNITVFTFIVLCCGVFSATVILYVFLWVSTSAEQTVLYLRS